MTTKARAGARQDTELLTRALDLVRRAGPDGIHHRDVGRQLSIGNAKAQDLVLALTTARLIVSRPRRRWTALGPPDNPPAALLAALLDFRERRGRPT